MGSVTIQAAAAVAEDDELAALLLPIQRQTAEPNKIDILPPTEEPRRVLPCSQREVHFGPRAISHGGGYGNPHPVPGPSSSTEPPPPPIPTIGSPLDYFIPHADENEMTPVGDVRLQSYPDLDTPVEIDDDTILPTEGTVFGTVNDSTPRRLPKTEYKRPAQIQLTTHLSEPDTFGFVDEYGYIVDVGPAPSGPPSRGSATGLGDATYFTAIAAASLIVSNYNPDSWESENLNTKISAFLSVLEHSSWSDPDEFGWEHPIRHANLFDYNKDGQPLRKRPLTRDSFGQILASCYYGYRCPNSSDQVRSQCTAILQKWIRYLEGHRYRLHSKFIEGEFESEDGHAKNIFDEARNPVSRLSEEDFILMPHELYALKSCAAAMGVATTVNPWLETSTGYYSVYAGQVADFVAQNARKGLSYVLDYLDIKISWHWQPIPRWPRSKIKVQWDLSLPRNFRDQIENVFESVVRKYCEAVLSDVSVADVGEKNLLTLFIDQIVDFFPETWSILPLGSVLKDLLIQVLPWCDHEGMLEFLTIAGGMMVGLSKRDSATVGFLFWNVAVEMEIKHSLAPILRPFVQFYFTRIKNDNNPNGLWAWLALDHGTVNDQLLQFENQPLNYWSQYAYSSTPYNMWFKDRVNAHPEVFGPASSRLDYLTLEALATKGAPQPQLIKLDLKALRDALNHSIEEAVNSEMDKFTSLGGIERVFQDALGDTVEEAIKAAGVIERTIWRNGRWVSQTVHKIEGEVLQTRWVDAAITDISKWSGVPIDRVVDVSHLVELQTRNLEGTLRKWTWDAARNLLSWKKWIGSTATMAATGIQNVATIVREVDGALSQVLRDGTGVMRSATRWAKSAESGLAKAEDCILYSVRDAGGQLRQWGYTADHRIQTFVHWGTSTVDGAAESVHVLLSAFRDAAGQLDMAEFDGAGVFRTFNRWSISTATGIVKAVDCIVHQFRDPSGLFQQWELDQLIPQKYLVWGSSSPLGAATGEQLILSVIRQANGEFLTNTFKDGVKTITKLVDPAGHVIKEIVDAAGGLVNAITGIFHGIHL